MADDGTVVASMGDDERFDHLSQSVARKKFCAGDSEAARRHHLTLLERGGSRHRTSCR